MAITLDSLKFKASERMTQEDDGGGRMGATTIVSGVENSIFDDISDVNRAAGASHIAKLFATVDSADTDKYLDAGIIIFKAPADPNVRVLATTTGSFYDERINIQNHIESYLVRGTNYPGFLYDAQIAGSRQITFFGSKTLEEPSVNSTLLLLEYTNTQYSAESYSQYVRVVRTVSNSIETFQYTSGSTIVEYERRVIVVELSGSLQYTFHGAGISANDELKPLAVTYKTVVADVARYYGIRPLVTQAVTGNLSVYADGIYDRIVPTSQTETPNLDVNGAAERTFAVAGASAATSFTLGDTLNANFTLYVGRAIMPDSLSIAVSGGTLTDEGGKLMSGAAEIGTVRYTDGTVIFSSIAPTYYGSKTVTFIPAAPLNRASNSFGIPIAVETRFRTYVANLKPVPNAGTLDVDYLSQGNWYRLSDDGGGILSGASDSYGAGTLNLTTGSVSLTLGAYPDVNSNIIFTYGSGASSYSVTGPETLEIDLPLVITNARTGARSPNTPSNGITAGSAELTWGGFTLTDAGAGKLTGAGGTAYLSNNSIKLLPTTIPAKSTVFTLKYEKINTESNFVTDTFPNKTADILGMVYLQLSKANPAALAVTFTVQAEQEY